ncbi:GNAT family N-acetyltransferase [Paenibacillus rhizophilus]|uniref:GNAT family N-acetyltransferase n=1 Tax=Paenibacillus rhizophilus TaxID=1850366 RepID=UPI0016394DB6|nr:GNAT family N-acetyltransferase [Paenibacillus rhizophilus]
MYKCRPIISDDFPTICSFPLDNGEVFFISPKLQPPLTVEKFKEVTKERLMPTVLVFGDEKVCGYCNFYNLEEGNKVWLGSVIVSPEFRGKGSAEFLIQNMMTIAKKELNVKELHLVCHNINTRGLMFYTKMGFKPYDVVKRANLQGQIIGGILMKVKL